MESIHASATAPSRAARPWMFVVAGGLVAGAFDIVYAWLFWYVRAGLPMRRILQSVAAGLVGPGSSQGGTATAALGLVLHFTIAMTMAAAYYLATQAWPVLARRPLRFGAVYGLGLYIVMNFVVVPLSAAPRGATDPLWVGMSIAVHVILIGIPIALAAHYARRSA